MERKQRPVLKGGGKKTLSKAPKQVYCRNHPDAVMRFEPAASGWVCPMEGCDYRRYRKSEVDQYGPPLVCEGPLSLTIYEDPNKGTFTAIVRGSNNVAVNLDTNLMDVSMHDSDDPSAYMGGFTTVELRFDSVSVIRGDL